MSPSLRLEIGPMHYYAKVKVSEGITELAVSNNGQGEANVEDVYSVKLDEASGRFAYEGRFDRIDANCGNSCGWSRHYRVMLDLLTGTDEIIPESIEGAIAELYHDTLNSSYNASLSTIKGSMTAGSGLTGRLYISTQTAVAEAAEISRIALYRIEKGEASVAMGAYLLGVETAIRTHHPDAAITKNHKSSSVFGFHCEDPL